MAETIKPSTVLPAERTSFKVTTEDGVVLIGEVAKPIRPSKGALLMFHPNPAGGGMMDSHVYRKAANRLPELADLTIVRFNTRGTSSEAGTSTGSYDEGKLEKYDVEAMQRYVFDELKLENVWIVGWSFGTNLALKHAKDPRHKGLILLSPTMMWTDPSELIYWASDGRPITALVPEHDEYLPPDQAREVFKVIPQMKIIEVAGAKHLWVGEPMVHLVLNEIVKIVAPVKAPIPTEY